MNNTIPWPNLTKSVYMHELFELSPYVNFAPYSTDELRNQSECRSNTECVPTYAFHHSITLTSNVSHFEVRKYKVYVAV